ncbi:MAG: hypothetical protein ABI832_21445, partial [bacterium]
QKAFIIKQDEEGTPVATSTPFAAAQTASVDFQPELMGWMPPPDGIAMCQSEVGQHQRKESIHGRSYNCWVGSAKASFPGSRRAS